MQIDASVNYHVKKTAPQAFEFDVDGVIGNLASPELKTTGVKVADLRDSDWQPAFDRDGIEFIRQPSKVTEFDANESWKATYDKELIDLLKGQHGAAEVIVFDHTIRLDDPQAPRRPARNVHNDYNEAGAQQRLLDLVGEARAEEFRDGGFGFVNVWRPVENAIKSSPLGFIKPDSIRGRDWMDIGLIYPDRLGQILGVAGNQDHQWFYRSQMTPDEAIIFNIYDSGGRPHLAHSALDLPSDVHATTPRQSIESRTLIRYS